MKPRHAIFALRGASASLVVFSLFLLAASGSLALTDENGATPSAADTKNLSTPNPDDTIELEQSLLSDDSHFTVYFNTRATDPVEGTSVDEAGEIADSMDCAWHLFHDPFMAEPDFPFRSPLGSPHVFVPGNTTRVPVWVRGRTSENGGGATPKVNVSPVGGLVGCPDLPSPVCDAFGCLQECDPYYQDATLGNTGYDPVAFHEYAHVVFKAYSYFLNSGPVGFLNEGLPSSLPEIPLNHHYQPPLDPDKFDGSSLERHLDVRNRSLRVISYGGSPFWYFLAKKYSAMSTPTEGFDAFYPPDFDLPAACQAYGDAVAPGHGMRWFAGRDVVRHLQEAFFDCHPLGHATPICTNPDGSARLAAECATYDAMGFRLTDGCIPEDQPDGWFEVWSRPGDPADEADDRVGEVLMPLVLEQVDHALRTHHGMLDDGMPFRVFREWLVANYEYAPAREVTADPGDPDRFRVKAFGGHYHPYDTRDAEVILELDEEADLSRAVYQVLQRDGDVIDAYTPWEDMESDRIFVYPDEPEATLVVTAIEPTYDGTLAPGDTDFVSYQDSGGHYRVRMSRLPIGPDVYDDEDATTPPPLGSAIPRNDGAAAATPLVLPDTPTDRRTHVRVENLTIDTIRDQDWFSVQLPADAQGPCSCVCGTGACSKAVTISVTPSDGEPLEVTPYASGIAWPVSDVQRDEWAAFTLDGSYELAIPCPADVDVSLPGFDAPLLSGGRELRFSVKSERGRTSYDLSITYHYLNCDIPAFVLHQGAYADILAAGPVQEPTPAVFPDDRLAFRDCLANPGCDPAAEFVAVAWIGGDFLMDLRSEVPAGGAFTAALFQADGKRLADAVPVQLAGGTTGASAVPSALSQTRPMSFAVPETRAHRILRPNLPAGWYFVGVDAPFGTAYVSQLGPRDLDQDQVPDLFDACPGLFDPDEKDGDGDGVPDACDVCPQQPDVFQGDIDEDGDGDLCDPATCGDGVVDAGEACDDGNLRDGDGCSRQCSPDSDGDGIKDLDDLCPLDPAFESGDFDGDGVGDRCDNCVQVPNPDQADIDVTLANGDDDASAQGTQRYGDACDMDFDNDGKVAPTDFFTVLRPCFGPLDGKPATCAAADIDGDGRVGPSDFFGGFRPALGSTPGPGVTAP